MLVVSDAERVFVVGGGGADEAWVAAAGCVRGGGGECGGEGGGWGGGVGLRGCVVRAVGWCLWAINWCRPSVRSKSIPLFVCRDFSGWRFCLLSGLCLCLILTARNRGKRV